MSELTNAMTKTAADRLRQSAELEAANAPHSQAEALRLEAERLDRAVQALSGPPQDGSDLDQAVRTALEFLALELRYERAARVRLQGIVQGRGR